ncbi:hypothetical protein [Nocardia inohanensis]|uniref:hypothetical protein n=1 Tax=Nocardia inohanensis TaxID=209246 RepID=UPI001C3FDBC6|nr:hypothetical protein [Nocardia inohanensis]
MTASDSAPCPECGSAAYEIQYGFPTPEMIELEELGEVALGGCCIDGDSPRWQCRACGTRYGKTLA